MVAGQCKLTSGAVITLVLFSLLCKMGNSSSKKSRSDSAKGHKPSRKSSFRRFISGRQKTKESRAPPKLYISNANASCRMVWLYCIEVSECCCRLRNRRTHFVCTHGRHVSLCYSLLNNIMWVCRSTECPLSSSSWRTSAA